MGLPKISINRGKGGLGRPLPGKDHISGFIMPFVNANLPSGFATTSFATRTKTFFSISEAETAGITQAGTDTKILWYHLDQYFKKQPKGEIYVHLADSTLYDFSEIENLQNFADGNIRQCAYFDYGVDFASANANTLQTSATNMESDNKPMSIIYQADFESIADISSLADLRALSNKNVAVCIGEDGDGAGADLRVSESKTIGCVGALLGAVSASKVHENIGWVDKFNMVDGSEFDVPALGLSSGTVLVKDQASSALDSLHDKGYIFLRKHTGFDGSYFNDSSCAVSVTSDYAFIESNRTIDKAIRGVRAKMIPNINSPLYVQDDGTLTEDVISKFKNDAEIALEQMERDGELSAFSVTINPNQDVLTTSKIAMAIKLVPVGVAREIEINIGFAVSIS